MQPDEALGLKAQLDGRGCGLPTVLLAASRVASDKIKKQVNCEVLAKPLDPRSLIDALARCREPIAKPLQAT